MKYQYLDFVIKIGEPEEEVYPFWVNTSSQGEASGKLRLPLKKAEMRLLLEELAKVAATQGAAERHLFAPARNLSGALAMTPQQLGVYLFKSLFSPTIRQIYGRCQNQAQANNLGLRFNLKLPPLPELYSLPWELLYDESEDDFLILSRKRPIVRYLESERQINPLVLKPPLRILVVMANPVGTPALGLDEEFLGIQKTLGSIQGVELTPVQNASCEGLREALDNHKPTIIHFMGHGDFESETDTGVLYLQDAQGRRIPLPAKVFANLVTESGNVELVFLNACNTARATEKDRSLSPFTGVATALVRAGIPAVVAMQFPVSDRAAITFCNAFYRQLVREPVPEAAVAEGRKAVWMEDTHTLEWATPVLFLRTTNSPFPQEALATAGESAANREALRERYLLWVIEQNLSLDLPGLPNGGRRAAVPLETVYVALRGDLSTPYERVQSQAALLARARLLENLAAIDDLAPSERAKLLWRQTSLVAKDPFPISIEERDRPQLFGRDRHSSLTLGEAFRRERRLVLLGDPGSGKTTLARWLTLRLAQACQRKEDRIWVPACQVDPAADPAKGEMVELGPARVPILLRVAAFAKAWQVDSSLTLDGFLGHCVTVATGTHPDIDPAALQDLLLGLLKEGRAVVLLDGLDEISDPADRHEIVRVLDRFLDSWLPVATGRGGPPGPPFEVGGNQVLITSRIVGYQMAPLSSAAAHLTIEPMTDQAVERFCDVWVGAAYRAATAPGEWNPQVEAAAAVEAKGLKLAIADLREKGAGDLARNPLLITILALVFRHGESSFPRQRAKLYDITVSILLRQWRERARARGVQTLDEAEMRALLAPVAAQIHEQSGIGVITEVDLKAALSRRLNANELSDLLAAVREEVGLLTARGEGIYGFLHLTFQEYLAGCALIEDRNEAPAQLLAHLTSPRWREPILLALGQLSTETDEDSLATLMMAMLDHPDPLGQLVPRAALLLAAAIPEMVRVPPRAVERIVLQLLTTYTRRAELHRFPALAKQVEGALRHLATNEHREIVDGILLRALCTPVESRPEERLAAASLVLTIGRFTAPIAEALLAVCEHDSLQWSWPIDRALRAFACRAPELLADPPNSLRRRLLRESELARQFLAHPEWLRVGVMLYGGIDEPFLDELGRSVAACDRLRIELLSWRARNKDAAQAENVGRLEKEWIAAQEELARVEKSGFWFSPRRMHRDAPGVTPLLVTAFAAGSPKGSLAPELWRAWQDAKDRTTRRDALLALIALGEPIGPVLESGGAPAAEVLAHLGRVTQALKIAVPQLVRPTLAALKNLAGSCPPQQWADLLAVFLDLAVSFGRGPLSVIDLVAVAPEPVQHQVLAEVLLYHFGEPGEDPRYDLAVLLDLHGKTMATPPMKLARALACAATSDGRRRQASGWSLGSLACRPEQATDVITTALEAIAAAPFDFFQNWALSSLRSVFTLPGLLLEAVIIALSIPGDASRIEALEGLASRSWSPLGLLAEPYPALALLPRIRSVADPYLRFRCYWRLLNAFPDLHSSLSSAVLPAAEAISEPQQRAWAFERIADLTDLGGGRSAYTAEACAAARRIFLPSNRARALARLASRLLSQEADAAGRLFEQALAAADQITDPRERSEVLCGLRPALAGHPQLLSRLDLGVDRLRGDGWNRARALGLNAPLLQQYSTSIAKTGSDPGALVLAAQIDDLRRLLALPGDLPGLWATLLTPSWEAARAALIERGRANGLTLTQEAALLLDRLLVTQGVEAALPLLPLLRRPQLGALPAVRIWLTHADAVLRSHANLLLAEGEGLSGRTLPGLLSMLNDTDDRMRQRASLVLHGDRSDNRWLTSASLGRETVEMLARECLAHREQPPIALTLAWTLERIEHNDGRALSTWAKTIAAVRQSAGKVDELILSSVNHLQRNIWTVFCEQLAEGHPAVQKALFMSLCRLLFRAPLEDDNWQNLWRALQHVDVGKIGVADVVLDPPLAMVEAAEALLAAKPDLQTNNEGEISARGEAFFLSRGMPLGTILQQDSATLRSLLGRIGSLLLVGRHYYERIEAAAAHVEQVPQAFEVLIEWLAARLEQNLVGDGPFHYFTGNLLCVVAASAQRLPNTYANKASTLSQLERRLRETAEIHNDFTGRQAAHVLLSYLREVTPHVIGALRAGLRDVPPVQKIVLDCVPRYRRIDPELLPRLFSDLLDPSPAVGFATAELLAALARNLHLPTEIRGEIIRALAAALNEDRAQRDVYLLIPKDAENGTLYAIEHQGRLDQILYRTIAQLSGTVDLESPVSHDPA